MYPTLNIQGEESKESTSKVEAAIKVEQITKKRKAFITQKLLNQNHKERMDMIQDKLRKSYGDDEI